MLDEHQQLQKEVPHLPDGWTENCKKNQNSKSFCQPIRLMTCANCGDLIDVLIKTTYDKVEKPAYDAVRRSL